MDIESLDFGFEIKTVGDEGEFSGLASTFGGRDLGGDAIERGAFVESIVEPKRIMMLWQHDPREVIGTWRQLRETDEGLFAKGRLVLGTQRGREAHELLKAGALDGLSIGFKVPKNGATIGKDGLRTLTKIALAEISLVSFPMNLGARVARVKSQIEAGEVPDEHEVERVLRSVLGLSRRQVRAFMAEGYAALAERLEPGTIEREELADSIRRAAAVWQ